MVMYCSHAGDPSSTLGRVGFPASNLGNFPNFSPNNLMMAFLCSTAISSRCVWVVRVSFLFYGACQSSNWRLSFASTLSYGLLNPSMVIILRFKRRDDSLVQWPARPYYILGADGHIVLFVWEIPVRGAGRV